MEDSNYAVKPETEIKATENSKKADQTAWLLRLIYVLRAYIGLKHVLSRQCFIT